MELSLPIACRPAAFSLFRQQLDQLQSTRGLLRAALAISMHELPRVQPAEFERRVARLSGRIRNRVRGHQRQALMAHLHDELFCRRNFRGNADDYYLASNSYLPAVLETGLGIPISLSLIYTVVARRLGLRADGINAPHHFLVQVTDDTGSLLVDPFHRGRILSRAEAHAAIQQQTEIQYSDDCLRPATHRQWIVRMLHNLIYLFDAREEERNCLAMQELLAVVQREAV